MTVVEYGVWSLSICLFGVVCTVLDSHMASACISESNLGLQTVVSLHQKDPEGEKLGSVWPAGSSLKLILANWKFYPKKHLRKGCGRGFEAWYAFLHRVFVIFAMPSSLTPLLRLAWGTKISMERIFRQLPAEPPPFSPTIRYPASFSAWSGKATLQKRLKSTVLLKRLDLPKRWSARWICQHQQMPGKNWSFLCTSVEYTTRWYKSATITLNCCGPWGNAICHQDEASCRAQWVWIKMVSQELWWLKHVETKNRQTMTQKSRASHALQFWPVPICTLGLVA